MSYLGQQLGQGQAERFVYTATGGETSVTSDDAGRAIAYTVGQVDVYLNGAKLINGSDFTATTGTSITGLAALTASDVVEVFALSIFQASDTVSAASGGTFNGNVTVAADLSVTGTADIDTSLNVDGTVTADGLTVDGTGAEVISVNSTANGSQINFDSATTSSDWSVGIANDSTDDFLIYQAAAGSGDIKLYTDGKERLGVNNNGDISFYEDTGTTAKLFWDASAESLGINDTSPARKLSVNSGGVQIAASFESTSTTSARIGLVDGNTTADNYVNVAAVGDAMALYAGAAERLRITSGGNVGIGTSSPSSILHTSGTDHITIQDTNNTNTNVQQHISLQRGDGSGIDGRINSVGDGSNGVSAIAFAINGERMRIDSSGNVGIGTSSPSSRVELSGVKNTSELRLSSTTNDASWSANQYFGKLSFYSADSSGAGAGIKGSIVTACTGGSSGATAHMAFSVASTTTNEVEAMRIDSSGNLLVGKTSNDNSTAGVVLRGAGEGSFVASGQRSGLFNRLSSDGDIVEFRKDNTTVGSIGVAGSRPYLSNNINFSVKIDDFANGSFIPADEDGATSDNVSDIGSASARWDDIYATNGTIQTSDANEKQDIEELSEAERRVAVAAKGLLRKFRWIDSVEAKGDEARIHFGIIAQDLQAAFEAEGLDAGRYAMFIHSTWTDEETGEERSRMGVRYSELFAFIIAAL